jgi:predicted TPR repeat methyltransferase
MFSRLKALVSGGGAGDRREIEFKRRGDLYLSQDRFDLAAEAYRQALAIRSDYAEAHVGLGFALAEMRDYAEAEMALERALASRPEIADAHFILGTIARAKEDLPTSIDRFSKALTLKPDLEFAYRNLFELYAQTGQNEQARALLEKGVSVFPDSVEFRINLGNLLRARGDVPGAIDSYRMALELRPADVQVHLWLGDAYSSLDRHAEAIKLYRRAIALAPGHVDAHIGLGCALEAAGMKDEAASCFQQALVQDPGSVRAHQCLGNVLLGQGDRQGALASYRELLRLQPDSPVMHLVAALSGETSDRPPMAYVKQLFDEYAENFEHSLVSTLRYDVPAELAEFVRSLCGPPGRAWRILDLGCGTGLSGLAFLPYAKEMIGVDLSGKMLEKAKIRNIYARLEQAELLTVLRAEPASSFDLVLAADVLVYLGKLEETFEQVSRVLCPGGLHAFSVESMDALIESGAAGSALGYQLNPTGRYAHAMRYLQTVAGRSGLEFIDFRTTRIRLDQGKPVNGYLVLIRRI